MYRDLLGEAFDGLHPHLRRAHEAPLTAGGPADVEPAIGFVCNGLARAMRLPRPGKQQDVKVVVTEIANGQKWDRTFGGQRVVTRQSVQGGHMVERRGAGTIRFRVTVKEDSIVYESVGAALFGISLPKMVAPRAHGVVTPTEHGWSVDVTIESPVFGLLCAYRAVLRWI